MLYDAFRSTRRSVGSMALVAAAVAAPLATASPAAAKDKVCAKPAHVVAKVNSTEYLFRKGTSLWACTDYYGDPPKTYRLGPWTQGHSKVSFDGSTAVWTVAGPSFEGVASDRVWAANAAGGTAWIKGVRPTLPHTAMDDTDNTVVALKASGESVAWVSAGGAVVMGVEDPQGEPTGTAIGAGTAATTLPPYLGTPQGLQSPLVPNGHRLFIGRWNNITPAALGKTLTITEGEGDGDECGGAADWSVTVTPVVGAPAVGATLSSYWTSTSDGCRGL